MELFTIRPEIRFGPEALAALAELAGRRVLIVTDEFLAHKSGLLEGVKGRGEALEGRLDYVLSGAVTDMAELMGWVWNKIERGQRGTLPNGLLVLKGGELAEELARAGRRFTVYDIARFFDEPFFETKKIVYLAK